MSGTQMLKSCLMNVKRKNKNPPTPQRTHMGRRQIVGSGVNLDDVSDGRGDPRLVVRSQLCHRETSTLRL